MYKAIVFDLDGTLLNTLDDLADAVNYALRYFSLPTRTVEQVRTFIGNGVIKLIERAVGEENADKYAEVLRVYKAYYALHSADKTKPYDGVLSLLSALKSRGIKTAVLSNKHDSAVKPLVEKYFDGLLCEAAGGKEGVPLKPAPL